MTRQKELDRILTKEKILEVYDRLESLRAVGRELGCSGETVRWYMKKFGIKPKEPIKHNCNHNFFSIDDEESFYVAGFVAADGCVKKHSGNKNIINQFYIGLSVKDESHLLKIKNIMKSDHKLYSVVGKNSLRNSKWKDSSKRELVITSEKLCNDLKKFNVVPRKTYVYTFPEWLINHPLVHHFMRGYNDGDGSFYIQDKTKNIPQVCFSLRGTPLFLHIYRSILERECDLQPRTKTVRVNTGIGVLEYGGNGIVAKIAKFLYKDATVMLDRKYEIVKGLI